MSRPGAVVRSAVVALLVLVASCTQASRSTDAPAPNPAPAKDAQTRKAQTTDADETGVAANREQVNSDALQTDARADSIELRELNAAQLEHFLTSHRGDVILVDFWATWCGPCVEGLPHTVALHRKYAGNGVTVATVAIDGAEQRDRIESLFDSLSPASGFHAFLASNGADLVEAMDAFKIRSGTLPTLRLYDRDGSLHRTFGDGAPEPIRFEEIEVEIRSLLKSKPQVHEASA